MYTIIIKTNKGISCALDVKKTADAAKKYTKYLISGLFLVINIKYVPILKKKKTIVPASPKKELK
jgi:hypothetical protein